MQRKDIYVHPSTEWLGGEVIDALARLAPVRFHSCASLSDRRHGDAILSLSGDDRVLDELSALPLRYFHVSKRTCGPKSETEGQPVRFSHSINLDRLLQGRTISHKALTSLTSVHVEPGDEVLAHCGEQPVWIRRRSADLAAHIVSAPPPELAVGEQPFDYLNGYHFIQLLPLLHFLREITSELGWVRPPLRACFTFDDPNLHWPSYGFLSYRHLIQQARKDRFHVAFATVPLDGWGPHSGAVRLLRENTEHLSLLIHGNDHTREELGQARTRDSYLRIIAQSLRRIEQLERATGLHVDRVMVPPHEALVDGVLATMLALGFEGASLAAWSLRHWNPEHEWPSTFGLEPAETTDGGFPVLGRYRLTEACEGPSVISGFLGRPIMFVEHHKAVAKGLDLLSSAAATINSLGDVRWCSSEAILRSNYLHRQENGTLWVKPYSCRVDVRVPEGISSVAVVAPEGTSDAGTAGFTLTRQRPGHGMTTARVRAGAPFSVVSGEAIQLTSPTLGTLDHRQLETPGLSVWALPRRLLCEARERLVAVSRTN